VRKQEVNIRILLVIVRSWDHIWVPKFRYIFGPENGYCNACAGEMPMYCKNLREKNSKAWEQGTK